MGFNSLVLDLVGLLAIVLTFSKRMKKFIKKHKWTLSIWISIIIVVEVWFCMNYQLIANKLYNVWFRLWYLVPDPADFMGTSASYSETFPWLILCPAIIIIWTSYEFFSSIKKAIKQNKTLIINWGVGLALSIVILIHAICHIVILRENFAIYMHNVLFWLAILCYNIFSISKWLYKIHKNLQHIFLPDNISKESNSVGEAYKE